MFGPSFKASKCKTQLKLCVSRVKLLRNKREMTVKQMKKEIAELLKDGKEPSATIRVEHILREEATMAAYDVIELFCELLCVRLPIIEANKECPFDLKEAIASIIFAAPRCADLPELQQLRVLFAAKYGKEFAAAAAELRPDSGVNRRIIEKLAIKSPSGEVKLQMLKDIAAEHNFEWDSSNSEKILMEPKQDLLDGPLSRQPAQAQPTQPQPIPTTPPQATAPTLTREESVIPPHLIPGAHDNPEQFQPPPSPDTPSYAINHPTGHDQFAGHSYSVPRVGVSPLGPTVVTGVPARVPSIDDEELFAPSKVTSEPERGSVRAPGGREEYADVAAAAAAAAESADRAAAAARAAARLAGSQAREGGSVRREEPRRGEEKEYRTRFANQEGDGYARKEEGSVEDDDERKYYEGEKREKGKSGPPEESDLPIVARPPRDVETARNGGGDSFNGGSEDKRKSQYQRELEYKSESQYRSENPYRGEASGKSGALLKKTPSDDFFSEPRSESGNGSEGSLGGERSQRKPPKSARRYEESEDGFDDETAEGRRTFAESGRQFSASSGPGGSGRGDDVFERQTSSKSNDSVARKFEEFEARGRGGDDGPDSGVELEGYDDDDLDLDLPGVPSHDPRKTNSFREAPSPFDEAPDVPRPEKGSYIPAGNDGYIFFHDEKRNVTLDEVPPPDTFDRAGRTVLPPPPGHPDRDRVIKATTPKRGNSPVRGSLGGASDFDDRFEQPSAPPVVDMDELTARFEALKSRH